VVDTCKPVRLTRALLNSSGFVEQLVATKSASFLQATQRMRRGYERNPIQPRFIWREIRPSDYRVLNWTFGDQHVFLVLP
jgi:hypothetical protein